MTNVISSQLTNAVLIIQRHKIESSGFLTIDVLYKKEEEKETCKTIWLPWIRPNKGKA